MPNLDTEKSIKQYWEQVKDKYPNIDFDMFRKICRSPFNFTRQAMALKEMPRITIKYFGKFLIYSETFKKLLKWNERNISRGYITQERYEERIVKYNEMFDTFKKREVFLRDTDEDINIIE